LPGIAYEFARYPELSVNVTAEAFAVSSGVPYALLPKLASPDVVGALMWLRTIA
jgi:hypothetical protein